MEIAYNISKAASGELVDSLLGGSALNYLGHRACVCWASMAARQETMHAELADLARHKDLAGGQDMNRLHREMRIMVWLSDEPHHLNST